VDSVLRSARSHAALGAGLVLLAAVCGVATPAAAHVLPDRSEPRVGHTVHAPDAVRIWFDGEIEPAFSTLRVETPDGRRVDLGDARVDAHDGRLLEVSLPPLPPGAYRVAWSVVGMDGHRTKGHFPFRVE
jgi:methionine-rich copper-binding protein CopC